MLGYSVPRGSSPLRQGDILEFRGEREGDAPEHIVVLTADCDLAQSKHGGRITCAVIRTRDEYILQGPVAKRVRMVTASLSEDIVAGIASETARQLSGGRFADWLREVGVSRVSEALGGNLSDPLIKKIGLLAELQAGDQVAAILDTLVQIEVLDNSKASPVKRKRVLAQEVTSHFQKPPGDVFLLTEIGPGLDGGYFVELRNALQIDFKQIALTHSFGGHAWRRISRLEDVYRYGMAQRFGMVFMSIGIPGSYEDECRALHDLTQEEYCG